MKRVLPLGLMALGLAVAACDDDSASDPATELRSALNPPRGLTTVTGDKKVELRFQTGNVEEDFQGYHVFAVESTKAELTAPGYPDGATLDGSVPRCDKNTKLFEAFGFPAIEAGSKECEGADEKPETSAAGKSFGMQADDEEEGDSEGSGAAEEEKDEPIKNAVKCATGGTDSISLPITGGKSLEEQVCVVTQAYDVATKAFVNLENGKTYTFFVVAVLGEDKTKISWTSNFVEDTPATPLAEKLEITVKAGKQYLIPAAKLVARTAITAADIVEADCTPSVCNITGGDNDSANTAGIYLGRLGVPAGGSSNFPQRTFVSTPSGGDTEIQLRGPQTYDPRATTGEISDRIPGDEALDTTYLTGTKIAMYGNQVFDIKLTAANPAHYGKLVIRQPSLEPATDPEGDMKVEITIIMQPTAGVRHYMQ